MSVSAWPEGVDPSPDLSDGVLEAPGAPGAAEPTRMVLSDGQWRTEATLLAWAAVEHGRVTGAADSRATTDYVNGLADNARLLAGGNARLYVTLLRSQLKWLRRLPSGCGLR